MIGVLLTTLLSVMSIAHADGSKVGFVNVNILLKNVPQAVAATQRLEEAFGKRKKEILNFQKNCQNMERDLEREEAALSQQQRQRKLLKIRSCNSELRLRDEEYGADLRIAQSEELQTIQRLLFKTIDSVAKDEGFDLIVNEAVVFASPRIDISRKVQHVMETISEQSNDNEVIEYSK